MSRPYIYSFASFFIFLLAGSFPIQGQVNTSLNWYFGSGEGGIRFNRGTHTPTVLDNPAATFGNGGGAVASDPITGNVLFYTDGSVIYDVTGAPMPNGSGLLANTSGNQAAATTAIPGQPGQYYVFTNTADFTTGGTIYLTTVDMTLPGNPTAPIPLGDVLGPVNGTVLDLTNRSEAMTLIPHSNGTDYWLITHENGTSTYTATLIDASGNFADSQTQNVGFAMSAGNFAYNAATGQIAVSPQNANTGVHILNFNNTTGEFELDQIVPNTAQASTADEAIYDVEWSSNGQYLYISVAGEPGIQADVLQFDLSNPTTTLASVLPEPNTIAHSYGLQMGPDSVIYHLYQETDGGPILLGALSNTDTVAAVVSYNSEALPGDFGGTQFPSFLPAMDQTITVDFTSSGTCANSPVSFFPTVNPAADSLVWSFGDGFGDTSWSPIHTYEDGGQFQVTLTAWLNGESESVSHPIDITQFDLQITLVQDTTACSCELPFPKAPNPKPPCGSFSVTAQVQGAGGTAVWSNGQTGFTLTPDSAGYYYVVVTDPNTGCAAYAGVNIREYDVQDQRANIWHFGQNAGLDFNPLPDDPVVAIPGPVNSPEGVSVISDRNGQVVFSTDGLHVYDKNGNEVPTPPSPPGLGGEPGATQSVLIMPVPGDETLFYIFTTQEVYGGGAYELRYSLYDVKLNDGDGGLIEYNKYLFSPSTERITGSGNWLIAHEYGNNSFRAYEITSAGISSPVISGAGSDHAVTSAESAQGYMKLGPGNKLAVALSTPGSNVIEVFDFNDSSGVVSDPQVLDLEQPNGQVYGIEFSPGGNKLYATVKGAPSEIFEFAFDSLGNAYFKQSEEVSPPGGEFGALQLGPDGQIYMAVNGSSSIWFFQPVEDTTLVTPFNNVQSLPLVGQSTLGLPNFIQNISTPVQGPTIAASGFCLGSPTDFNATGRDPNIETFSWSFGDGHSTPFTNDPTAQHEYASAGSYPVALTLRNRCDIDTVLFTTVVITAPPDSTISVQDGLFPNLCDGPLTLIADADEPDLTYLWSTGETTRTIEVSQQAIYSVTITNPVGCTSNASILVAENRPIVELGPDLTLCQDTPATPLDAQNPGATYQWSLDGVNTGTSRTQSVDTSVPGIFEYRVEVTDPITSCTIADSLTLTINPVPEFDAIPADPSACGVDDGSIAINIEAPASLFTYSVGVTSVSSQPANPLPAAPYTVSSLGAGTYGVTVTDQITGCFTTNTVSINNNMFDVVVSVNGTCDPMISLDITTTPAQTGGSYTVFDNATSAIVVSGNFNEVTFNVPIPPPADNRTFVVEVTSTDAGCVQTSDPVSVNLADKVPFSAVDIDACSDPITIAVTADAQASFEWSGPGVPAGTTGSTLTVSASPGINVYTLHAEQSGFCALDTTITVNVDNNVVPSLTQSSACDDRVIITATPSGQFLYRWYDGNGDFLPNLAGPQVIATEENNGAIYRVEIYNPVTGCSPSSSELAVNVIGALELTLESTLACEGSPFTITGTTNVPVSSYQWSYEGSVINGETSPTLEDSRAGLYEALVSLTGCTAVDEILIQLSPSTPGSLPSYATICNDPANTDPETSQVVLDPGAGFTSYAWFLNGVAMGVTDPTLTATEPGEYTVDLVNAIGCPSTDHTTIEPECQPKIVGPNAFHPGGLNSDFFLYTFFIDDTDFEVFIFSRWGELVFQSTNREFRWNGGYNNSPSKPLPPGTYAYLIKYKSSYQPERGVQEKRGGVVLLR